VCLNSVVIACVLNESKGHWLLFNALMTIINLIVAMESQLDPFVDGVKHVTNLMLNSRC
jgi:hypothetical protein